MTDDPGITRPVVDDETAPRLALKPPPPASVYLDGAWWPRSTQLAAELPGLVARLSDRLGEVAMVDCHLNAWTEVPSQLEIAGHTVQLQGFTSDEPGSVILIGRDGRYMGQCWSSHPTPANRLHDKNWTRQQDAPTMVSLSTTRPSGPLTDP